MGCTPPHAAGRAHHVLDALAAGLDRRADLHHALLQVAERELRERTRHQLAHLLRAGPGSGAGPGSRKRKAFHPLLYATLLPYSKSKMFFPRFTPRVQEHR